MRRLYRSLHPLTRLASVLCTITAAFLSRTWTVMVLWIAAVVVASWIQKQTNKSGFRVLLASLPFLVLYLITAALQWSGPSLGRVLIHIGNVRMTSVTLFASLQNVVHVLALLLVFTYVLQTFRTDDLLFLLRGPLAKIGLTLAMAIRFLPQLLAERDRIVDVLRTRSTVHDELAGRGRFSRFLTETTLVYRALLANSLERAWQLAESMHVRGYGSGKRTHFLSHVFRLVDLVFIFGELVVVGLFLCSMGAGQTALIIWFCSVIAVCLQCLIWLFSEEQSYVRGQL